MLPSGKNLVNKQNLVKKQGQPIGIFDSGIGGLSIAHAIKSELPNENLIYFADQAFSPYGDKSQSIIKERAEFVVHYLISQGCKAVVVACNTATVNTISYLREIFSVPIIGVEPGIKPAALQSKTNAIGVLATERTISSDSFQLLKAKYATTVSIESIACPKFVTLVENFQHNSEEALAIAEHYIRPLLLKQCDQIILGCTHFSFLHSTISKVVRSKANIIDTALPVALEVKKRLQNINLLNERDIRGNTLFWTNTNSAKMASSINHLWKHDVEIFEFK